MNRITNDGIIIKCSSGGKFEAETDKIYDLRQIY